MCPQCREKTVLPVHKDYTLTVEHDGCSYEVTVRDVQVPTCSRCGEAIITNDLSERVSAEVRRTIGLLSPETIRERREALGLSRPQLAAALRVAEATLLRWETGMQLQPRALDLLLRLYFDSADVRQACITPPLDTSGTPALAAVT
jgi:putative zinc finger/helix-turn-helix YgiT family protein